jgi:hypothetical protein
MNMNMKRVIITGGVIACLMVFASAAHATAVTVKCTGEVNPIFNSNGTTKLVEDCLVQVISSDSGTISPALGDGTPTGDNKVVITGLIGSYPTTSYGEGEFSYSQTSVPPMPPNLGTNTSIFLRAWNSTSISTASKYGNSAVKSVAGPVMVWRPVSFSTTIDVPSAPYSASIIGTGESTSTIRWTWTNYPSASWYEMYSGNTFIASVDATSTVEVGLSGPNAAYPRKVRAITGGGSDHTAFTTYEYTAYTLANPATINEPTRGWKSGQGNYVTVTWGKNGNPDNPQTYYQVKRNDGTPVFGATTGTTTTDVNRAPNTLCTYEVVALNKNLTPAPSSGFVTTTTPPGRPTLEVTGYTTNEITWSWGAVPGATAGYNFYINGIWIPTTEVSITRTSLPCDVNAATVEAVSSLNGTGEPAALNKWTLPTIPSAPGGSPSSIGGAAANLSWTDDNVHAIYEVERSLSTNEGWAAINSNVVTKTLDPAGTPWGATLVCFRVRARNQNSPTADNSAYSPYAWLMTSASQAGTGHPVYISQVKFNGKPWHVGMVISSRPHITAILTCEVPIDTTFTANAVWVDEGMPAPAVSFAFASDDITFETVPNSAPNTRQISIRASQSIPALPQSQHYLTIKAKSTDYGTGLWTGTVGVGSGGVQMIGAAYNYPNPFRPLSSDPLQNTTRISYNLNVDATVTLIIYDITGHEVYRKTAHSGSNGGQAGLNSVPFNGQSMFGEALGNGMYLYKIISGGSVIGSGKLVVLD